MKKLLVIVDMQNDFITGSLANPDAEKIVPGIVELIKNWDGDIVATQDRHFDDYLETQEGKRLPVLHCIYDGKLTGGDIIKDISEALTKRMDDTYVGIFCKHTFGSTELGEFIKKENYDEVYFCGTCTDICVISNAIICKAYAPETTMFILQDSCAGTTPENHENALKAMKQCQIDIE